MALPGSIMTIEHRVDTSYPVCRFRVVSGLMLKKAVIAIEQGHGILPEKVSFLSMELPGCYFTSDVRLFRMPKLTFGAIGE